MHARVSFYERDGASQDDAGVEAYEVAMDFGQ
jgi:hypothetical protein